MTAYCRCYHQVGPISAPLWVRFTRRSPDSNGFRRGTFGREKGVAASQLIVCLLIKQSQLMSCVSQGNRLHARQQGFSAFHYRRTHLTIQIAEKPYGATLIAQPDWTVCSRHHALGAKTERGRKRDAKALRSDTPRQIRHDPGVQHRTSESVIGVTTVEPGFIRGEVRQEGVS